MIRDGRRVILNLNSALPVPENNNKEDSIDASGRRIEVYNGSGKFGLTVGVASANDRAISGGIVGSIVTCLMIMTAGAVGTSLTV